MYPHTIYHPQPRLLLSLPLIITMFYPTLKVLIYLKVEPIYNPTNTASTNGTKLSSIGKDSVTVSIMYIAPANALIHRKAASFEHLIWMVYTLKGLHTSSKLIHLASHQIPVDTRSSLQKAQII